MTTTHHSKESWEHNSRQFLKQFVSCTQKDPDCEGCIADLDAVIEHIRSLLLSVAQETRKECVDKFQSALAGEKMSAMGQFKVKQVIEGLLTSLTAPTKQ